MGKISLTVSVILVAAIWVSYDPDRTTGSQAALDTKAKSGPTVYRSPLSVAISPDGQALYVSDRTAGCVTFVDASAGRKLRDVRIGGEPNGLAISSDGKTLYVSQRKRGSIALVDTARGVVTGRIKVGPWPVAVALAGKSNRLYSCNRGDHTVSVVDLSGRREIKRIAVVRDPAFAVVSPDESQIIVTNFLPAGAGTDPNPASEVSIIDARAKWRTSRVKLPRGSTMARGAWISPDGKWAYATHLLGRFDLPVTQLEQGWVHTTAFSIIDLAKSKRTATILLDDLTKGAADPWAIVGSNDGRKLWISHRGVHEVSTLNIGRIHELLAGKIPEEIARIKDAQRDNIWVRIKKDKREIDELTEDLTAIHISKTLRRTPSGGKGPTGLTIGPDEKKLYAANYYEGSIGVIDTAAGGKLMKTISLGSQPKPDAARRGEIFFHDATQCHQQWHSCASCHLDNGRTDALTWDFLRDGIDNGKDVISLVYMQHTPPHNRLATRANPWECMQTGIVGSHFMDPAKAEVDDLLAYVKSIKPEPNPNLPKAAAIKRGKLIFEGKGACSRCHSGPMFTDKKSYDIGTADAHEPGAKYDTPSLVEAYRTAPYYHDGRAATMKDALTKHDPKGLHGRLKDLNPNQIADLVAYVLSL